MKHILKLSEALGGFKQRKSRTPCAFDWLVFLWGVSSVPDHHAMRPDHLVCVGALRILGAISRRIRQFHTGSLCLLAISDSEPLHALMCMYCLAT